MNKVYESPLTIPYVKVGDYYFPNFALPPDAGDIGYWGRRHKEFLREHRPITFNQLVLSGELFKYLALFNQQATERLENLIQGMKIAQGITEELKSRDQMAWVGAMNNIRACAEEIIYTNRLTTRAQMLEEFLLEPEVLTNEDVRNFLMYLFNYPANRQRLQKLIEDRKTQRAAAE